MDIRDIKSHQGTWTIECEGAEGQEPPVLKALSEIFKRPKRVTRGELFKGLKSYPEISKKNRRRVKNLFRHFHFQCLGEPSFDRSRRKWMLKIKKLKKVKVQEEPVSEPLPN